MAEGKDFHNISYNILSYLDDAQSLCRAEQVCREWCQFIADELLWKKLIERKVKTNPVWRGLSQRRGWDKHLFRHVTPSEGITHDFCRQLYPNIIRDMNNLQINWKNGHHTLTRIECSDGDGVFCLQYDNEKIVSGHGDATIKIWDRKTLSLTAMLQGHTGPVTCLQYDDRAIVTGSADSTIRVWDVIDGSVVNTLDHHSDWVCYLRFNSKTMVTSSKDRTVAVWDMISPKDIILRTVLQGHGGFVNAVELDEKYIISASSDATIKLAGGPGVWCFLAWSSTIKTPGWCRKLRKLVWQTSTGELVRSQRGHTGGVFCLQYRGNHIVSGSSDRTIRIWDIESGACLKLLKRHKDTVGCIRFDDRRIVSGSVDGVIKVWDFQAALDPRSRANTLCLQTLRGHSNWVGCRQLDDFQIVSGSRDDGTILIWDFLDPVPPGPTDTDQSVDKKALT